MAGVKVTRVHATSRLFDSLVFDQNKTQTRDFIVGNMEWLKWRSAMLVTGAENNARFQGHANGVNNNGNDKATYLSRLNRNFTRVAAGH